MRPYTQALNPMQLPKVFASQSAIRLKAQISKKKRKRGPDKALFSQTHTILQSDHLSQLSWQRMLLSLRPYSESRSEFWEGFRLEGFLLRIRLVCAILLVRMDRLRMPS